MGAVWNTIEPTQPRLQFVPQVLSLHLVPFIDWTLSGFVFTDILERRATIYERNPQRVWL